MPTTIVTVGMSPSTTLSALLTFESERFVLVHGPARSKAIAESVRTWAADLPATPTVELLELPLNDPSLIIEALDRSSLLEGADLVYGGGTTPMNVLTYHRWRQLNEEANAWYLASADGVYLPTTFQSGRKAARIPGLAAYLRFHGARATRHSTAPRPSKLLTDATSEILLRSEARPPGGWPRVAAYLKNAGTTWRNGNDLVPLRGRVLEDAVGSLFDKLAPDAEVWTGVQFRNLEADVLVWTGCLFLLVSCGIGGKSGALRQKGFEAKARAGELGGGEARSMTVVSPADFQRMTVAHEHGAMERMRARMRFDLEPRCRDVIVSGRELFGQDVGSTFDDPSGSIHQEHPALYRWLKGTLDLG